MSSAESPIVEAPITAVSDPQPGSKEETAGNTTDEQIDNLLREVELIKQKSPVKFPVQLKPETSQESTPDSTVLSDHANNSSSDSLDEMVPCVASTATTATVKSINKDTQGRTIPNSVSQALFTSALKVTRVRDKSSAPKYIGKPVPDLVATQKIESLQQRDYELMRKIRKLQREIEYLKNLIETASVSSNLAELRKLRYAIERLEDFLDQKQKEKYEVGIQLTRAVRKRVDSGELGEFWST